MNQSVNQAAFNLTICNFMTPIAREQTLADTNIDIFFLVLLKFGGDDVACFYNETFSTQVLARYLKRCSNLKWQWLKFPFFSFSETLIF
jgi:hypothetical protein